MRRPRPRVAVCGIHIESSTFTPYLSGEADFVVTRGDELMARFFWRDYTWAQAVDWVPVLHAQALPGGVVKASAYGAWKAEILEGLAAAMREGGLDGLFFDIHGAMSVEGLDDAEGDLISAIRAVIGSEPFVSASMDLHGNVSEVLFDETDLLTCYRMAPHEDALESRMRAAKNLVDRVLAPRAEDGSIVRPAKALMHVPVLLPGEKTSTRLEPAKSLYAQLPAVEVMPGILDASIWIGFAWADQPRCQAAICVYGDDDALVRSVAADLGEQFWAAHDRFEFVAPTGSFAECLRVAEGSVAAGRTPFFISDSGDNPGAGGADDVTVALAGLLEWEPLRSGRFSGIYASIVDPVAVAAADAAGVGGRVDVSVGGKIDTRAPGPVEVAGAEVVALADDPMGGRVAALRCGGLVFVVTSRRHQYATAADFARLGLEPTAADVVVVKIGYLEPDLFEMQAGWMMALTPGGVDQDLLRLGHHRVSRPLFPFDTGFDPLPLPVRFVAGH
ncbi:M81 family metallopeptidase [Boudabousia marimammalium]|uniref:Microcystin degradation protein MlrC n=1 Tax=Boudabousia marimammalium TaxID=156892 RepID=A0A1Q5PST9_9ACTO|nr:M81 family metallopeptidase [Boudabousia marimammalium]OKL50664.1 microcystin degradation protein MlrC [Boudabousia marimammalium]